MSRDPETLELEGDITITSQPLKYEKSEDLLPDMIGIGGLAFSHVSTALDALLGSSLKSLDVASLASAFGPLMTAVSERLRAGELKRLAPLILACTSIAYPDEGGKKINRDLSMKDDRCKAFEDHPELYFIALGFAAKVSFGKYFPAIGPLLQKLAAKLAMMKVPSHPTEDTQS